jgi:Arc/MetJ-type ribon-helix-helix transcriptional regulator
VFMISVNVRIPEQLVGSIDEWVQKGMFASRSDAIKSIVTFYVEREKTLKFAQMLNERSVEARDKPEKLIPLE